MKNVILSLFVILFISKYSKADIAIINTTYVNHNYTVVYPDSFPGAGAECDVRVEVQNFATDIPANSVHLFVTYLNTDYLQPDFVNSVPAGWELSDSTVSGNETTLRFTNTFLIPAFFNYVFLIATSAVDESSGVFNALNLSMDYVTAPGSGWAIVPMSLTGFNVSAVVGDEALPVDLLGFYAQLNQQDASVQLHWITTFEQNNMGFYIQKSENGVDWRNIDLVYALSENGFSNMQLEYKFIDNSLIEGQSFYRLMQVDYDGKSGYSLIREINYKKSINTDVVIYPNPAKDLLNIKATNLNSFKLYDINGRYIPITVLNSGSNELSLDIHNLPAGIYFLTVNNNTKTHKVIIAK